MSAVFGNSVECIEGHNAGMPVKVVFLPHVPGETMIRKREYCATKLDHIRKLLTYEPRSGSNSYGVVVTNPPSSDAHFGAIYFDPSGWHDMCGHATMFLGSLSVQRKLVPVEGNEAVKVRIDTPAGRVTVTVHMKNSEDVDHVSLENVPSFVLSEFKVHTKSHGKLSVPVVFGGDFYAMIDLDALRIKYSGEKLRELEDLSTEILADLKDETVEHPTDSELKGVYGVRYHSMISDEPQRMHGVLFFGTGKRVSLDRSPSGTSSSAHLAFLYFKKKQIAIGQGIEFMSVIGTKFVGSVKKEVKVGKYKAIIPEISTTDKGCFITGFSTYVVEEQDPVGFGFKPLEPF